MNGKNRPTTKVKAAPGPVSGTTNSVYRDTDGSQQVSWWHVHEFVVPVLASVGSWPMAGTPAWCDLPATDPRKLAAIFDAAQHWALRVDMYQAAMAQASHDVADAADWSAIAQEKFVLDGAIAHGTYIPRAAAS